MANSRLARFVTEVAPPQVVSVMRRRASKMLDTINEEERDVGGKDLLSLSSKNSTSSSSSSFAPSSMMKATTTSKQYFLKEVQRSISIFGH